MIEHRTKDWLSMLLNFSPIDGNRSSVVAASVKCGCVTPLGGLEPPTFRLTAERASQLRHRCMFHVRILGPITHNRMES